LEQHYDQLVTFMFTNLGRDASQSEAIWAN